MISIISVANNIDRTVAYNILEIKQLLTDIMVMGEVVTKDKWESGCLKRELGALNCRHGCPICGLDKKMTHLEKVCPDVQSNTGIIQIMLQHF